MHLFRPLAIAILLVLSAPVALANVSKADSATVFIGVFQNDDLVGIGSGFFITPTGHLITNQHVISVDDARFFVIFEGEKVAEAFVVDTSRTKDLALLSADVDEEVSAIALAQKPPEKGAAIFALGFPGSQVKLLADLNDMGITGSISATVTNGGVSNFMSFLWVRMGRPRRLYSTPRRFVKVIVADL